MSPPLLIALTVAAVIAVPSAAVTVAVYIAKARYHAQLATASADVATSYANLSQAYANLATAYEIRVDPARCEQTVKEAEAACVAAEARRNRIYHQHGKSTEMDTSR